MAYYGTTQKCKACDKTVHFVEMVSADGVAYHKTCFKCSHCNGRLAMSNYSAVDGNLYCKPHFEQLFKETGSFTSKKLVPPYMCHIEETNGPSKAARGEFCDSQNTQYPCKWDMGYYGRGPIQLSWNHNYGVAGESIGFDGLNDPDIMVRDHIISFKTALWFWMNQCHQIITLGEGFGGTIRAINGLVNATE